MVVFACVMAIHMGLIDAVLGVLQIRYAPIVTCPKCLAWWSVMAYCLITGQDTIPSVAVSFLCSYIALWYDLLLGYGDMLYEEIYERLYGEEDAENSDV